MTLDRFLNKVKTDLPPEYLAFIEGYLQGKGSSAPVTHAPAEWPWPVPTVAPKHPRYAPPQWYCRIPASKPKDNVV